ncbi:MAG: hypothetical protein ACKOS8_04650 [Gemmataceae bacterium]
MESPGQPAPEKLGESTIKRTTKESQVGGEPLVQVLITARNIMMLIGVFHLVFFGWQIPNMNRIVGEMPIPLTEEGEKQPSEVIAVVREKALELFTAVAWAHVALGIGFVVAALLLPMGPAAIVTVCALVYLAVQIRFMFWDPTTVLNGLVLKIGVIVGLFYSTRKILESETGQRAF